MTTLLTYLNDPEAVVKMNGEVLTMDKASTTTLNGVLLKNLDMGDKIVRKLDGWLITVHSKDTRRQAKSIRSTTPYWASDTQYQSLSRYSGRYGGY